VPVPHIPTSGRAPQRSRGLGDHPARNTETAPAFTPTPGGVRRDVRHVRGLPASRSPRRLRSRQNDLRPSQPH
jgi:hypothetical protein